MDKVEAAQVAAAVADQLAAERELVASRLNWNLTFQGFMIASYALVATADASEPARQVIQSAITMSGLVVAGATLAGVRAASRQSDYLKQHWFKVMGEDSIFPRPFSVSTGSRLGRLPPRVICGALMAMWCVLQVASIMHPGPSRTMDDCRQIVEKLYDCYEASPSGQ